MTDEKMVEEGAVAQVNLFGIDDQQGGDVKMMEGEEEGEGNTDRTVYCC